MLSTPARARPGRLRGVLPPLIACALVAALAQLPLLRNPWIYFYDDAAIQILPVWHRLGELVLAGRWPPLLDVDGWMGGNFAVESLHGVWNPVYPLVWIGTALAPDLAVAGALVRTLGMVALALGVHLLCAEYGARRSVAAATAVAVPLAGSLYFLDTVLWPAALLACAWVPYVWWAARRMAHGRSSALWAFLLGGLGVAAGNPYGMLAISLVLVALVVESAVRARWRAVRDLVLLGAAVAAVVPLVYLPLLLSSSVTWRAADGSAIGDSGVMAPAPLDLLGSGLPHHVPDITGLGGAALAVPAVYTCWFAVPLLPWLDWGVLRRRWRELSGCAVVAAGFLALAIGPSELWMFRWPLRVLHYGFLALAVVLAVLLSGGLRTGRAPVRAVASVVLLLAACGATGALEPARLPRGAIAVLLVAGLTALALLAFRLRGTRWLAAALQLGTAVVFAAQVTWFVGPPGTTTAHLPSSVAELRERFEDRYRGTTFQIAVPHWRPGDEPGAGVWRDLLPGSMYPVAGVRSINSYTGIGFQRFSDTFCFSYDGGACPDAYAALWREPAGTGTPLADLLRLDTVVVQRELVPEPDVPAGWSASERSDEVTVLHRDFRTRWPRGTLTHVDGARIRSAVAEGTSEVVEFAREGRGPARLLFARLAWPGYRATTADGVELPVSAGPAGLLRVDLPPGQAAGEVRLTWAPPGSAFGAASAALGCALALGLAWAQRRRRRSPRPREHDATPVPVS
ncbi:hypothetical protein [Saccharopolyspora cebuensis]|uniref:hypothetical protein n=1 Tax=Saccharopolyspora cebuensis TaxID=418759 RepID=UPI0031EB65BB